MIHPTAQVNCENIGKNTQIWQFVVILPNARIGENCNINCHVFIENDVIIGNNVTLKSGVQLWDGITIEDDVFIGPNVTFTNDIVPRSKQYPKVFKKTIIRKGASLGANATIVAGHVIGEYALVGAGALVSKDVPPCTLWYGNPAKHRGYITEKGVLLNLGLVDKEGNQYKLIEGRPRKR